MEITDYLGSSVLFPSDSDIETITTNSVNYKKNMANETLNGLSLLTIFTRPATVLSIYITVWYNLIQV